MLRPALLIGAALVGGAAGHGSMVHPRPRQSIDYLAGVNTEHCSNLTGAKCENGQAAFYYSQGVSNSPHNPATTSLTWR